MIKEFRYFNRLNEQHRYDYYTVWDEEPWWYNEEPNMGYKKYNYTKEYPMTNFLLPKILPIFSYYEDIIKDVYEWAEDKIKNKTSINSFMIPSTSDIKNFIINEIGTDYQEYISNDKLEELIDFIWKSIDDYIFD